MMPCVQLDKKKIAAAIEKNIDANIDPCEDFYTHSCGTWAKKFKLPGDHSAWTRSFDSIGRRVKKLSKEILEGTRSVPETTVPKHLMSKLTTVYNACMDDKKLDEMGVQPVKDDLKKYVPRIESGPNKVASLMQVLADLGAVGRDKLFSFGIGPDAKHPLVHVTSIGQSGLTLPDRSYYLEEAKKDMRESKYLPFIASTLARVSDGKAAEAERLAELVLGFETAIASITVDRTALRDPVQTYHMLTKEKLYALMPSLEQYFAARRGSAAWWEKSPTILLSTPSFFEKLGPLLASTPAETLQAYLTFHIALGSLALLSDKTSYPIYKFFSEDLSGTKQRTSRWKRCYGSAGGAFPEILGRAFVGLSFRGDSKQKAASLISMIMKSFASNLHELAWLDDITRDRALYKLSKVTPMVGFPNKWREYRKAHMTGDHFTNSMSLAVVSNDRNLGKLGKPVDPTEWSLSTAEVNAYYDPESNRIVFPAAILQPPFFSAKVPMAMNFGAIGIVMGHELTHGFDDQGSQYAADGALKSWWEPKTTKLFQEKTKCVSDQYSEFHVPGPSTPGVYLNAGKAVHLNGKLTLGENLADNGGLANSLGAYHAWAKHQEGGLAKQGAGAFSGDQLFFYAFAQAWCGKQSPKAERMQMVTDPHSPNAFRVNGAVSNSPAFASAFKCKPKAKMNPEKKCAVWTSDEANPEQVLLSGQAREVCSKDLSHGKPSGTGYVCDTTNPWLHYAGKSWAPATPPSGCHKYVYLEGTPPEGCTVGAACPACRSPQGSALKTISIKGGDCSTC